MRKGLRSFLVGYGALVITGLVLITGGMFLRPDVMRTVFAANGFTPHGYCLLWEPGLVWLYVVSDTVIGLSYVGISVLLAYLVHRARRDIPFHRVFLAFGAFIIACGSTHFMDVWTLWTPTYWLAGSLKFVTAVASVATAVVLPPLLPKALAMITEAKMSQTRKHRLEAAHAELEVLYRQTTELDRLKTQFFANVSHELRTPLTLILGPIERLLATDQLTATQREDLTVVARNGRTLLKHVNDLLDVAKLEAGKMKLQRVRADLTQIVRLTAAHFDALALERHIRFTVETPSTLPVQVDIEKIQRICLNLLSNAFKFTPDGGTIGCTLHTAHDCAVLTVEDSGPGVPAELRDMIFAPFQQADGGATRQFGGTGLGLAIAKEFIELHGGKIMVEDAPGGGARFQVELPQAITPDESIEVAPESIESRLDLADYALTEFQHAQEDPSTRIEGTGSALVLVVEDNPDMRRFLTETLAVEYQVVAAVDGQQGLEQAVLLQPDLILSDVMMPRMSGDQFVRAVRTHQQLDKVPIVLLTARANDDLRVELLNAGAQDYLIKPFSVAELRARIANLISIKRTRDVLQMALNERNQDITVLANEMAQRSHDLERALRVRDVFLSIASHELKTPVTALLAYTELLQRRVTREQTMNERDQRALQAIVEQAHRLNKLIMTLLDLSRLQDGRMSLERETLNLVPLAQRVVDDVRPTAVDHTILLDVPTKELLIEGDALRLEQVLYNLLQNAVKYSPAGGTITVLLTEQHESAAISVSDQGLGIPQRALPHIFERFYRADTIDPQQISGFGIGLYLVREIVMMHGGRVEVDSQEGVGSRFTVILPYAARNSPNDTTSTTVADTSGDHR